MYLQVFIVGLLAGISPGPDFFIVMKNGLGFGRRAGIASALGIGTALAVHASYTILGIALVLQRYPVAFKTVQVAGAAYLAYLGIRTIASTFARGNAEISGEEAKRLGSKGFSSGFRDGFLCNILNPKAFLFFLSIFTQFMTPGTPHWTEWIYGLEVVVSIGGWFVLLAAMISTPFFLSAYSRCRKWFERVFGIVLIFFAAKIASAAFGK